MKRLVTINICMRLYRIITIPEMHLLKLISKIL